MEIGLVLVSLLPEILTRDGLRRPAVTVRVSESWSSLHMCRTDSKQEYTFVLHSSLFRKDGGMRGEARQPAHQPADLTAR